LNQFRDFEHRGDEFKTHLHRALRKKTVSEVPPRWHCFRGPTAACWHAGGGQSNHWSVACVDRSDRGWRASGADGEKPGGGASALGSNRFISFLDRSASRTVTRLNLLGIAFGPDANVRRFALVLFAVAFALMVGTLFVGPEIKGPQRLAAIGVFFARTLGIRQAALVVLNSCGPG